MKQKAIIVSGYFNPLHKGHLELFQKAKAKGDMLWVIVNSDFQRELKGSKPFMEENERFTIIKAIRYVDKAIISLDKDKTQCATLAFLANDQNKNFELYFEVSICKKLGIGLIENLGDKIQSSSWLLKESDE